MALSLTKTQEDLITATNKKVSWLFDVSQYGDEFFTTAQAAAADGVIETNATTGWISNYDTFESSSVESSRGTYSIHAVRTTTGTYCVGGYNPNSTVVAGRRYRIAFDVKIISGSPNIYAEHGPVWGDRLIAACADSEWVSYVFYVTAPSTSTCVRVGFYTEQNFEGYLDNVSIKECREEHWSTRDCNELSGTTIYDSEINWNIPIHWDGEETRSYDFKIMDFNGVEMSRSKSEIGLITPNELSFWVSNKDNSMNPSQFEGGTVKLSLRISDGTNEEVVRRWRFRIKRAELGYQKFRLVCEDFLQKYLRGNYPNLRLLKDLFPSDDTDFNSNVCLPVPIGSAYIPLRSVYVSSGITATSSDVVVKATSEGARCKFLCDKANAFDNFEVGRNITTTGFSNAENNGTFILLRAQSSAIEVGHDTGLVGETLSGSTGQFSMGSRYYVLGSTKHTYNIANVRSPRAWGRKSEWASGSYSFNQYTKASPVDGNNYRMFHAIIADVDNDGTADAPGLWRQGDHFLDMPTQFTRSDTSGLTNPADAIHFTLKDMGVDQNDLDLATFDTAKTTYTSWSHSGFNGGYYQKQPRRYVLLQLLAMAHSNVIVGEGVELHPMSATSQKTINKSHIVRTADRSEGTFQYRDVRPEEIHDSGEVAWQESGEAQDKLIRTLVAGSSDNSNKLYPSGEVLSVPFVTDSQDVQKIGMLYYQRKHNNQAQITMVLKGTCLELQPGDVITISHADYGGTHVCVIDSIKINKDCSMTVRATKYSVTLQDWDDLSPSAMVVWEDDSNKVWQVPVAGPLTAQNLGQDAYEMWAKGYVIVGPTTNKGEYNNIQTAVNALVDTDRNGLYLLSGTYNLTTAVHLSNRNIEIIGESQEGVVITVSSGRSAFKLRKPDNKSIYFSNFKIKNLSSTESTALTGDLIFVSSAAPNNNIHLDRLYFDMKRTGILGDGSGDVAFRAKEANKIIIERCVTTGGAIGFLPCTGLTLSFNSLTINNNKISHAGQTGVFVYSTGRRNINVSDNQFINIAAQAVQVSGDHALFQGNTVLVSSDLVPTGHAGIVYVCDVIGAEVQAVGNSVSVLSSGDTRWYGMRVSGNNCICSNNKITVKNKTTSSTVGLYVGGNDVVGANNTVVVLQATEGDTCQGIVLHGNRTVFTGNQLRMGGYAGNDGPEGKHLGIGVTGSNNNIVANIIENASTGYKVVSGSGNTTAHNRYL